MDEVFNELYPIFEQYGIGGVGVAVVAYGVYLLSRLVKTLHVNPSLGEHLAAIAEKLDESNELHREGNKRVEDIWDRG